MSLIGVSNWWIWGKYNWVGYIKLIFPFVAHLTNYFYPKLNPTQLLWVNPTHPITQ